MCYIGFVHFSMSVSFGIKTLLWFRVWLFSDWQVAVSRGVSVCGALIHTHPLFFILGWKNKSRKLTERLFCGYGSSSTSAWHHDDCFQPPPKTQMWLNPHFEIVREYEIDHQKNACLTHFPTDFVRPRDQDPLSFVLCVLNTENTTRGRF